MAKKARQRISYVLPLANSPGGHRLGVNGLAVDTDQSILYSGGRDGAICAWDLNLDLKSPFQDSSIDPNPDIDSKPKTTFRSQTQTHTHWVNDIVLAQNNTTLVSASSDLTVRTWRPFADDTHTEGPHTIGRHADYVKCLASPSAQADWVASGGLDHKICLWDLSGAGKKLAIEISDEDKKSEKGSVYALSASRNIIASGGPECILRLWDVRTGKRITKFMGHTDNVRDILINWEGNVIMTASSDQTVKVWSVTAGRCMHTLTMHNDSVWSLFSDDPQLGVFYSGDKSGLVVKTDVRGTLNEMEYGLSLAVAQETAGVSKVIASGDYIWTATSSSSINRWGNVDTGDATQVPEAFQRHRRGSSTASRTARDISPTLKARSSKISEISPKSVLRISNTATFPAQRVDPDTATVFSANSLKRASQIIEPDTNAVMPIYTLPEETIEGQHGLVKHKLLNDRRRVLTLDTAGDVLLWDLLHCAPIRSFGKRHLEDVEPEVNTMEAVAPWCSVDTRTGRLAVVLEEYNCFDAEMYADELVLEEPIEFREDQRINLGKWILRHIFSEFIDEQIRRDEAYRKELVQRRTVGSGSTNVKSQISPLSIEIPTPNINSWQQSADGIPSSTTPRANGSQFPITPGMGIGIATPALPQPPYHLPGVPEDNAGGAPLTKNSSQASNSNTSASAEAKPADYFGASPTTAGESRDSSSDPKSPTTENADGSARELGTSLKKTGSLFGKNFKMGSMSFGTKKRSASIVNVEKTVVPTSSSAEETKSEHSEDSEKGGKEVDDNLSGVIQRIHNEYDRLLAENESSKKAEAQAFFRLESGIMPSLPNETPVLKLPAMTTVIIQEETSGGSADLYLGTVGTVGRKGDVECVEREAPTWLGELLLQNRIPFKEPFKVSFVLLPWKDLLPGIAGADGNSRLNANRMLRVKKILAYVAERIEILPDGIDGIGTVDGTGVQSDSNIHTVANGTSLKAEEYLELYCYDQKLPITMTLATLRAHVWKGGADVMLYYRSNGRIRIKGERAEGTNESGFGIAV